MAVAVTDLLFGALAEIRVARAGDGLTPEDQALALSLLNEYLDQLNAQGRALYATMQSSFTLTPNHQPHTIGLAANAPDFAVTVGRPAAILKANLILTGSIRRPIDVRDEEWWMTLRAPAITSSIPMDLVYNPAWPNGEIKLWPVPTTAYGIELWIQTLLGSLSDTDTFDLPFGYQAALRLTLAELCAPSFGRTVSEETKSKARDARGAAWGTNDAVPNISTRDGGMPSGGGRRGRFDFRTGFTT
jgi:hypothetical protein